MFSGLGPAAYWTLLCWAIPLAGGLLLLAAVLDSARSLKSIDKRLARIEGRLDDAESRDEE